MSGEVNGQIHVKDTGDWLATIDTDELHSVKPVPVEIDILIDGYWYTYTLAERSKHEEEKFDKL